MISESVKTTQAVKPTILMVDDQANNLKSLEAILGDVHEKMVGVQSGEEALKHLLDHEAAVILLDVQMPHMDGFETAQLIRNREQSKHTPIIFITAENRTAKNEAHAYTLGAVDFIFKPIVPHILRAKVSVFIDLYTKTERIKQQQAEIFQREKEQQDREIQILRAAQQSQKNLVGWEDGSVTAKYAGVGPLRERAADVFAQMQQKYELLLDAYLESIGFNEPPPRQEINALATQIGELGGGPRDLVDLHVKSVANKSQNTNAKRASVYTTEGRLLALETMGYLLDYYRMGRTHFRSTPQKPTQ